MTARKTPYLTTTLFTILALNILFTTSLSHANTTNIQLSPIDRQIEQIKKRYSLFEGWDLTIRAPSSLSSESSHALYKVNERWQKFSGTTEVSTDLSIDVSKRLEAWRKITRNEYALSTTAKLLQVNNFFNRLAFKSDQENWGLGDYWASPIEFLSSNAGDCEDYAIAKYFTLTLMGIPIDRLRIVYVKAANLGQAHMVLAYYEALNQDPLILDNLNPMILPASKRPDLIPVYSFNG